MNKQLLGRVYFDPRNYQQVSVVRDRKEQKKYLSCTCGGTLRNFNRTMREPSTFLSNGQHITCHHIRSMFTGDGISRPKREARVLEPALEPTAVGRTLFAWRWVEKAIMESTL